MPLTFNVYINSIIKNGYFFALYTKKQLKLLKLLIRIVPASESGYIVIMIDKFNQKKEELIVKLKKNIRKKAIKNLEQKLAYNQKQVSDFHFESCLD